MQLIKFTKCQSSKQSGFGQIENRRPNSVFSCSYVVLSPRQNLLYNLWVDNNTKQEKGCFSGIHK